MSWFNFLQSKKDYPDFWKRYLEQFKAKKSDSFVAFDCETTGLNPKEDRILSIGVVKFTKDRIFINKNKEWFINQTHQNDESVKIHGILPNSSSESLVNEEQAILNFLECVKNSTLVGHHINFDVAMVNYALQRLNAGKLKNQTRDTNRLFKKVGHFSEEQNFSLDHLCEKYQIKASNRHTALGDAYITALVFQRLLNH